jgi:tripartite-type tricarboxylate transporter receptor subunit TctC
MMRLKFLLAGLLGAMSVGLLAAPSAAQNYPDREIKLVVGFPAGGSTDILARIIAEHMSTQLGQPVIVENRGGANGATATRFAARSTPDGYTLIFNSLNMAVNLHGMKEPGYAWDDFAMIGGLAYAPLVLVTNTASSKAKSLKDMVAFGKANPGQLKFASIGPQSLNNLVAQKFNQLSGIAWREVPYKGSPQVMQDLVSGNVDAFFGLPSTALAVMSQPNIAVLGLSDKMRNSQLPNVPTFIEAGFPALDDTSVAGIWAPAGTPKPVIDRLRKAMAEAMKSKDIKAQIEKTGNLLYKGTPEQFDREIRKTSDEYGVAFKRLGIEPN